MSQPADRENTNSLANGQKAPSDDKSYGKTLSADKVVKSEDGAQNKLDKMIGAD
jgi:hypothetical protein